MTNRPRLRSRSPEQLRQPSRSPRPEHAAAARRSHHPGRVRTWPRRFRNLTTRDQAPPKESADGGRDVHVCRRIRSGRRSMRLGYAIRVALHAFSHAGGVGSHGVQASSAPPWLRALVVPASFEGMRWTSAPSPRRPGSGTAQATASPNRPHREVLGRRRAGRDGKPAPAQATDRGEGRHGKRATRRCCFDEGCSHNEDHVSAGGQPCATARA